MKSQELRQLLITLETSLHLPEVRSSRSAINKLLADDFVEFGASGRVYNKQAILDHLPQETSIIIEAGDFNINQLSDTFIQLTYKSISQTKNEDTRHTLRSSIWKYNDSEWKMIFHQGTISNKYFEEFYGS